jgi:hypothetical protein
MFLFGFVLLRNCTSLSTSCSLSELNMFWSGTDCIHVREACVMMYRVRLEVLTISSFKQITDKVGSRGNASFLSSLNFRFDSPSEYLLYGLRVSRVFSVPPGKLSPSIVECVRIAYFHLHSSSPLIYRIILNHIATTNGCTALFKPWPLLRLFSVPPCYRSPSSWSAGYFLA